MNFCSLSFVNPQYEELEKAYIRPRSERSILILTGRATKERLVELEAEEMSALYAILDLKMNMNAP